MKLKALLATLCMLMHHNLSICMEEFELNTIDASLMLLSQTCGFSDHVVALSKTSHVATQDPVGRTRLHYAVMLQDVGSVQLLLKETVEKPLVTIQDTDGNTPLHTLFTATCFIHGKPLLDASKALAILELLLTAQGVDYTLTNKKGETAVHCAVKKQYYTQTFNDTRQFLAMLTRHHKACLDVTNHEGETPLHYIFADAGSDTSLCSVLLELGATPDPKNNMGETPLHYAVMHREYVEQNYPIRIDAIKALCAHNADPNSLTDNHETPLHYVFKCHDYNANKSSSESRLVMAPILLELGANPNAQNRFGVSPLCALMHSSHTEQKQAIARDMLEKRGANPNLKTKAGFTCLHTAVCTQQLPWVRLLLEHKATDVTLVHEPTLTRAPSLQAQRKTALDIALEIADQESQQHQQQRDPQQPVKITRSRAVVGLNTLKNNTPSPIDEIVALLKKHTQDAE